MGARFSSAGNALVISAAVQRRDAGAKAIRRFMDLPFLHAGHAGRRNSALSPGQGGYFAVEVALRVMGVDDTACQCT